MRPSSTESKSRLGLSASVYNKHTFIFRQFHSQTNAVLLLNHGMFYNGIDRKFAKVHSALVFTLAADSL